MTDFLDQLYNFTQHDLKKVDIAITSSITSKAELIPIISEYLISLGGKRLRPIITILAAKLCGYFDGERHYNLAAAVEFIHTATLLHDDVVDESSLRRGKETANNKWGNKAPILVGDFLLSQAFILMVKDGSLKILEILSDAAKVISEGEVMQLSATRNLNVTEEDYTIIIKAKTAKLFAAAAQVGAVIANVNDEKENALIKYGDLLGIAFQIMDDMLDYQANQTELGKKIGDDFREGKVTLPVILSYKQSSDIDKKFWERVIKHLDQNENDLNYAVELIRKQNIVEQIYIIAQSYVKEAKNCLDLFPDSEAKNLLNKLLDFSITRHF